jgi:hypothetical protein
LAVFFLAERRGFLSFVIWSARVKRMNSNVWE